MVDQSTNWVSPLASPTISVIWQRYFRVLALLVGVGILLDVVCHLGAEIFWFQEVGYLSLFLLRLNVQIVVWVVVTSVTTFYLLGNLKLAQQLKHPDDLVDVDRKAEVKADRAVRQTRATVVVRQRVKPHIVEPEVLPAASLRLRSLLPLTIGLSLLVGILVAYYGQVAFSYWQPDLNLTGAAVPAFDLTAIGQFVRQMVQPWLLAVVLGVTGALVIYPQFFLRTISIGLSISFGWVLAQHWTTILQYFHPTSFDSAEPLFGRDISFYIFALPFWELIELWLGGLFLYGFVAVVLTYLLSGNSLSQGRFWGFTPEQQRHLFGVGGFLMSVVALNYWLGRYELVYSHRGVTFGASYTDATAQLPINTLLSLSALTIAGYLLWRAIFWRTQSPHHRWFTLGLGLYGVLTVAGFVVPEVIQYLIVQPNELVRERPYIERTIALTRQAFGLEAIDARTFNPEGQLTQADLAANDLTVRNIRLWDQRPLLETNRQLQQIRLYYRFPDANIDRYTLRTDAPSRRPSAPQAEANSGQSGETERRQVLISARELDYGAVPQQAQTWVNRHLIYTHGYGFTISPVNTASPGGLPEYFVKDISGSQEGSLSTSSPAIRASIPIGQPRIYYGEISDTYVMTGTRTGELDYPSGSDNVYNVYDGRGGIGIGSLWRRLMFSVYLKDWQLLFTRNFLPETKVLFRRKIDQRIRTIAPFLRFDQDPYLVVADTQEPGNQNYLHWIVDAFTTSDRYPYSDTGSEGINYIRNSVKVVVDAYHGSVRFYVADPSDPIIRTWSAIFPQMFQPLSAMPVNLRSHIRYPVDFFRLQAERLMTYHMTDPQVFYNREDQWQIPNEVYGNEPRPVEPYYLITSLPTVPFEEFILLLPYVPRQRTNLIAWLAARSDGENYGKLLLYVFPKERLVYGPEQIEARINQDPVISQQISLWNRQGSRAIQGNLLVIPIEQSLLYVEPLYLEAEQNSLPTLVRVIVAYENRIVMAPTLEEALQAIFRPELTPAPTIIRPVEEPAPGQ